MVEEKKCKYCATMIPKEAKVCPNCRMKQPISTGIGCLIIIGVIIFFVAYANFGSLPSSSTKTLSPKEEALSAIKLDYKWKKTGFGNVMEANFIINNPSKYNVKDIEIKCSHFAQSGTMIDSNSRVIYEIVNANSKKKIKNFNMGFIHTQAASTSCAITNLEVQ